MAFNILFVCTGNTCRSPMAEGLLKTSIPPARKNLYSISSAGTQAAEGLPASGPALQVMQEEGIDISGHRSRQVTSALAEKADLILALTDMHAGYIADHFPEAARKTYMLADYADKKASGQGNIHDPAGASLDTYRDTRDQIKKHILKIAGKM